MVGIVEIILLNIEVEIKDDWEVIREVDEWLNKFYGEDKMEPSE